jgi:hypothetical protein
VDNLEALNVPKASPIQSSFNAGEFGPELEGRVELSKYAAALWRMENFFPLVQGPARRRGGTMFVAEVKDSGDRCWLGRFQFNTTQSYVIEFGDLYLRLFTDNGVLESAPDTPLEVTTPYTAVSLTRDDGSFALEVVQSLDTLYICHPDFAPRVLIRSGATSWALSAFTAIGGPFEDTDPDETVSLYASAQTGSVTVTADGATFAVTDIGRLLLLERKKVSDTPQWEADVAISTNELRRSDGKTYKALNGANTGTVRPTHFEGAEWDGNDDKVQWQFQDPGYGWGVITAYTSSTVVTMTVLSPLPQQVTLVAQKTTRWAFGSWGSVPGYPSHVTFFRNRLVFLRALDRKVWCSVPEGYDDFSARDESGDVVADQAITRTLDSPEANLITWVSPGKVLLIGTAGSEFAMFEQTEADPFGPENCRIVEISGYGGRGAQAVKAGDSALFVQADGRVLREASYDALSDGYKALDMTVFAPHSIPKSRSIVQMAWQKAPHSIVWCARDDGALRGFTFNKEQYESPPYGGWHRHPIGGDGIVESVVCVPSPDNDRIDLWMIVQRTIDGGTKRYVERMVAEWETGDAQEDAFYVDSGLTYDGAATTTITGLDHLEGETVDVLADGGTHPQRVVFGGSITLQQSASVVHVGLPCPAKLATLRPEAGAADGTAQGKIKRIHRLIMRLLDTLGGRAGPTEDLTDTLQFRTASDPLGSPPPIFTGDKELNPFPGQYDREGRIWYINDQPLPATIVALMPQMNTQDG